MARSSLLYGKVARRIHSDRKFRALKPKTQHAWLILLTSEHQNGLPGFWRASEAMILDEWPYSLGEWRAARTELEAAGMLRIDDDERLVWLVNAVKSEYNAPDNPNIACSWARKLAQFDSSPLLVEYLQALAPECTRWALGIRDAFCNTLEECGLDISNPTTRRPASFQLTAPVAGLLEPPAAPRLPRSKPATIAAVREVFDHWVAVMQHAGSVLDPKRERVIRAALKLRSVEDCKRAIDGCRASAWHMGENDRQKVYDSLGLIFRDAEHTEQFIGYLTNPSGGPVDGESDLYRFDK